MKCSLFFSLLASIPKTLYFNFRAFPPSIAYKLPVIINWKVKIVSTRGQILLPNKNKTAMIKIGFSGSFNLGWGGYFSNDGEITFNGKATFSRGIQLVINKGAKLTFGDDFRCNSNCIINSGTNIHFSDDVLLSWGVTILDGDGHKIRTQDNNKKNNDIIIGSHVWICSNVTILKGTRINKNVVVSSNSLVNKNIKESNVVVGGVNEILRKGISWEV